MNKGLKIALNNLSTVGFFVFSFLLVLPVWANHPTEEWVAHYNGPGNSADNAVVMTVDNSGNVYVAGRSPGSSGSSSDDYATIKYDAAGNELWVARYNGPGNYRDLMSDIVVDSGGNVYVTGSSPGLGTDYDYATIKYNAAGNELWLARYNGPGGRADFATDLVIDSSGNVTVTGYSNGSGSALDYATVQYDSAGNQLWVARYNGPGNSYDFAEALAIDSSGHVTVAGGSDGLGSGRDYAVVRYDSAGNELWVARYNGTGNGYDVVTGLAIDSVGNVTVTGFSDGSGSAWDYATVRYDSAGNQLWATRYDGIGNSYDAATDLTIDSSGNVTVTGYSRDSNNINDYATVQYDSAGNQLWVARYNGPGNGNDSAAALAIDSDGGVVVTGSSDGSGTSSDYTTIKYDLVGNELWVARYNGTAGLHDLAADVVIDNNRNIYVTGFSSSTGNDNDYATIKYNQEGSDSDGDGVLDGHDVCPSEDATGFDADGDGCIDTLSGITETLETFVIDGVVDSTMENSLVAKIESAEGSSTKENICAAVNEIEAFKNQIEAQRGKKISDEAADLLIAYADNIIASLLAQLPEEEVC